jgi:hypothetical protein
MPNTSKKKKSPGPRPGPASAGGGLDYGRAGMPAQDSVVEVRTLRVPSGAKARAAKGRARTFRVIRTNEVDGYERAATPRGTLDAGAAKRAAKKPRSDNFEGTARRAAKLSIARARTRSYKDLRNLFRTLTPDAEMAALQPKISTKADSGRVAQEERNVRVRTFLYAASREDDNDFHLILGRDPNLTPEMYLTMELSGLPPEDNPAFVKLKAARDAYKAFFAGDMPGTAYDFYDPPIPVEVEGSIFWDASHAKGTRPGPKSLRDRIPTVWEVHPISKITFNP